MRTRCREYAEGRIGRYHTFRCQECGGKFQVFLTRGNTLARKARVCFSCDPNPERETIPIAGSIHS